MTRARASWALTPSEQEMFEALGQQEGLNAWSSVVDSITHALSYAKTWEPPERIPERYVQMDVLIGRIRELLTIAETWSPPGYDRIDLDDDAELLGPCLRCCESFRDVHINETVCPECRS
jgi:hypothetical protein